MGVQEKHVAAAGRIAIFFREWTKRGRAGFPARPPFSGPTVDQAPMMPPSSRVMISVADRGTVPL